MIKEELQQIKIETQEKSSIKIEGEIPFSYLEEHRAPAIKHIGKEMAVDGFRKGHLPEKMIIDRVGEMALLTEMAERALSAAYPAILKEHQIDAIGYPQISITKLAKDNPLGFSAIVAVMPEIPLPDYKKIAAETNKKKESDEVTDKEVEEQVEDVLRQKVAYERLQEKAAQKATAEAAAPETGDAATLPTPESEAAKAADDAEDIDPSKLPLPELTDEYVKTLGQPGQFENVADFKAKIREHLEVQKKQDAVAKHRAALTDAIVEKATIDLPQVMIDAEINQMFGQMQDDLTHAQLNIEDYLGHIKKTREELTAEWTPAAEKRAKLQLILNEIAKQEDIKADQGMINQNVSMLLEKHKEADDARVRIYVTSMLTNEEVMKMLENQ